ncbi:N-acetyltransferase [Rhodococcus sp. ABRD24]|uniref:GNAT family N-acetyltransferase n=1 Tax=Rhodococcus sp. ABRD24 TaxID=2507582 RepID=UPI00103AC6E9|nr:GNAT family N-acetyltransferase [Rhodococcus sp. ABRD24]QBJ95832.1 N-acetyltransferase [Rhodococcus sp. ABRD24]
MNYATVESGAPGSTAPATGPAVCVVDSPPHERYELWVGGDLVGILGYQRDSAARSGDVLTLLHTVVREDRGGRGWAAVLVREVLDRARREGTRIRPVCTYVRRFLGMHTEYLDLLDEQGV